VLPYLDLIANKLLKLQMISLQILSHTMFTMLNWKQAKLLQKSLILKSKAELIINRLRDIKARFCINHV